MVFSISTQVNSTPRGRLYCKGWVPGRTRDPVPWIVQKQPSNLKSIGFYWEKGTNQNYLAHAPWMLAFGLLGARQYFEGAFGFLFFFVILGSKAPATGFYSNREIGGGGRGEAAATTSKKISSA